MQDPRSIGAALQAIRDGAAPRDLEGDLLEFKQEDPDLKRTLNLIADAVVCLANSEGGSIVVGIADSVRPNASPFLGVSPRLTVDIVRHGIFERTRPALSVAVSEEWELHSRLILVGVPKGAVFYANASGTATRRIQNRCAPFTPEEQRQVAASRGQVDWSATTVGAGIDCLAGDEIARLRRLLVLAGRDDLSRADDRKLLRDLRLVEGSGEVTRAGLLLLGREVALADLIPTHGYAYQYRASPGSESSARARGNRPVLAAIETLLEAVSVRSQVHPINVAGGVQLQVRDYPPEAIRELVVNGLIHRDYEQDGSLDIEHSPESLTVTSPGGLVFGVTPDNILTHPSTPRHRLLDETVTLLQVAERTGQGIDRAYRELLRAGKPPPQIADDGFQVRVLVAGGTGNDSFSRFVADLNPSLAGDVEVLLAMSYLRDRRTIDAPMLAALAQRSPTEAQAVLDRLTHADLVLPSRRTARRAFPTYGLSAAGLSTLGRAVRYHVRQADDVDKKVIDQVEEYGHVTNQTLRRLFDLDLYRSRNLLRDLQERGILAKVDRARGGPGIKYGRGPNFPASSELTGRASRARPAESDTLSLELLEPAD